MPTAVESLARPCMDEPTTFLICTKWDSKKSRQAMREASAKNPEVGRRFSEIVGLMQKEGIFDTFEVIG